MHCFVCLTLSPLLSIRSKPFLRLQISPFPPDICNLPHLISFQNVAQGKIKSSCEILRLSCTISRLIPSAFKFSFPFFQSTPELVTSKWTTVRLQTILQIIKVIFCPIAKSQKSHFCNSSRQSRFCQAITTKLEFAQGNIRYKKSSLEREKVNVSRLDLSAVLTS